jgi:hypothetical protein
MRKSYRLLIYLVIGGSLLETSWASTTDFLLARDGVGPIFMTIDINVTGDTAEMKASARNDSGQPIHFAKFCIVGKGRTRGCDFELWTTAIWKPGERLIWSPLKRRWRPELGTIRVRVTKLEKELAEVR